ncbi:hypothetical protein [Nocardia sp. IFM 10818]
MSSEPIETPNEAPESATLGASTLVTGAVGASANGEVVGAAGGEVIGTAGAEGESAPDVGFRLDGLPDVGFSLEPPPEPDVAEKARRIAHRIAQGLLELGPQGWARVRASFSATVNGQLARVVFADPEQRQAQVHPTPEIHALAAEHRALSAELGDGPWWRLELDLSSDGELEVDHDYGDEPFPDDQLFAPEDYLADLEAYPRAALPVWLAAYVRHGNRQIRTPQQAAAQARADRESGITPVISEDDFPDFPLLWARWSAIAAAFVAIGSQWGPRVLPSFGWFEGSRRSGSTLYSLPGGRAVLSGGVWNAPELAAAYNTEAPLPRLYAGAPEWVATPVLNTRAAGGLLTFCYWWEDGRWHRGESPASTELASAVPGMWTAETVADVISGLVAEKADRALRTAVENFVAAAEQNRVDYPLLVEVFGNTADLDGAAYQLTLAGTLHAGRHRAGDAPRPAEAGVEG